MNNSSKHTWIISILAVIVIALFVVLTARGEQNEDIDMSTSTVSQIYGTSTVDTDAELQAPSQNASSVGAAAGGASASQPRPQSEPQPTARQSGTPTKNGAATVMAPTCDASMLDGSASWQSQASSLTGVAKITNRSSASCRLSGHPSIYLSTGSGFLGIGQINQGTQGSVTLVPKQNAYVSFTWSNWCNQASVPPTRVRVVMPGTNTYLELPFIDSLGRAQAFLPSCNSTTASSIVTVNSFSI